jgi:hypothetical protein
MGGIVGQQLVSVEGEQHSGDQPADARSPLGHRSFHKPSHAKTLMLHDSLNSEG